MNFDIFNIYQDLYEAEQIIEKPFKCGEMRMLGLLYMFKDGMTAGELSKKMNVTTPRIAQIINTLEKKGRLCRKMESTDKRIVSVYLTEEGRDFFNKKYEIYVDFLSKLIELMGEDEIKKYLSLSKRVKQIAKQYNTSHFL